MKEIQTLLIQQALREYGAISPCSTRDSLYDCFTVEFGRLMFWFNTQDNDTHLLVADIG
jgi:hypothetical protein